MYFQPESPRRRKKRRKKKKIIEVEEEPVIPEKRIEIQKWEKQATKIKKKKSWRIAKQITIAMARDTNNGDEIWYCIIRDFCINMVLFFIGIAYVIDAINVEDVHLLNTIENIFATLPDPVLESEVAPYLHRTFDVDQSISFAHIAEYKLWYNRPPIDEETYFFQQNVNIAGFVIRMKQVSKKSCRLHELASMFYENCHRSYSEHIEDTSDHGMFDWVYPYVSAKENYDKTHTFEISSYCGGGHIITIANELMQVFDFSASMLRNGTTAVIIDMLLFNQNYNKYIHSKLVFEAPVVGGIVTSHYNIVLSMDKTLRFVFGNVILTIVTIFITWELVLDVKHFQWRALTRLWVIFDAGYIMLTWYYYINSIMSLYMTRVYMRTQFKWLYAVNQQYLCNYVGPIWGALTTIRILKILNIRVITLTLEHSINGLIGFLFLLIVILFSYAIVGRMIYGKCYPRFRNYSSSIETLILLYFGDFSTSELFACKDVEYFVYPFIISYLLIINCIVMNIGLGIINQAYRIAKTEIQISPAQMGFFDYIKKKLGKRFQRVEDENLRTNTLLTLEFRPKEIREFLRKYQRENEILVDVSEEVTIEDIYKQQALFEDIYVNVEWALQYMKDLMLFLDESEFIFQAKDD